MCPDTDDGGEHSSFKSKKSMGRGSRGSGRSPLDKDATDQRGNGRAGQRTGAALLSKHT